MTKTIELETATDAVIPREDIVCKFTVPREDINYKSLADVTSQIADVDTRIATLQALKTDLEADLVIMNTEADQVTNAT